MERGGEVKEERKERLRGKKWTEVDWREGFGSQAHPKILACLGPPKALIRPCIHLMQINIYNIPA